MEAFFVDVFAVFNVLDRLAGSRGVLRLKHLQYEKTERHSACSAFSSASEQHLKCLKATNQLNLPGKANDPGRISLTVEPLPPFQLAILWPC